MVNLDLKQGVTRATTLNSVYRCLKPLTSSVCYMSTVHWVHILMWCCYLNLDYICFRLNLLVYFNHMCFDIIFTSFCNWLLGICLVITKFTKRIYVKSKYDITTHKIRNNTCQASIQPVLWCTDMWTAGRNYIQPDKNYIQLTNYIQQQFSVSCVYSIPQGWQWVTFAKCNMIFPDMAMSSAT